MLMHTAAIVAQFVLAASIVYVWIFRFDNIVGEFRHFGYAPLFRNAVGVAKLALATLLVVGVWVPVLVIPAALGMAALMVGAQWAHFRVSNPAAKRVPSAVLLLLALFIAGEYAGLLM